MVTTYVINNVNEYTSSTTSGDTTSYQYDADGNLIAQTDPSGTTSYTFNELDQLTAVNGPGLSAGYSYDALGNRISQTINGTATNFEIDPTNGGAAVASFGAGGVLTAHYTYGSGLVSQVSAAGVASYYDFNLTGSTVGITNSAGVYVNTYSYLPFGGILTSVTTVRNPFQFVGQWGVVAGIANLSLMGARAYNPSTGQFVSNDPLGLAGGDVNVRRYASDNPVAFIDPTGLCSDLPDREDARIIKIVVRLASEFSVLELFEQLIFYERLGDEAHQQHDGSLDLSYQHINNLILTALLLKLAAADISQARRSESFKSSWSPDHGDPPNSSGGCNCGPTLDAPIEPTNRTEGSPSPEPNPPTPPAPPTATTGSSSVQGRDPNSMVGPAGYGSSNFVATGSLLPYEIIFENEPIATAPAQRVDVTDPLDPNLDWGTLQLSAVGFGSTYITIPAGLQHYDTTVNTIENGQTFEVKVSLNLDAATGVLSASFQSIDPTTGLPPADVLTGFLPPEDGTGRGIGISATRSARGRAGHRHEIRNVAGISFDFAETIATDQVDHEDPSQGDRSAPSKPWSRSTPAAPTSQRHRAAGPQLHDSFTVELVRHGRRRGPGGIASYDVFVSDNGGAVHRIPTGTTQTSATFTGQSGHTYGFYSVATDNVGIVQPTPTAAQATTTLVGPPTSSVGSLPATTTTTNFTVSWSGTPGPGATSVASYTIYDSEDGGPFTAFLKNTTSTSTTFTGQPGHTYGFYSVATDNLGDVQPTPSGAQASTTLVGPPTSAVKSLPPTTNSTGFTVSWSGTPSPGASIASYTIFDSEDGGPFMAFLTNTTLTSATFTGQPGHTYGFFSVATDNRGDVQPTPNGAQTTIAVANTPTPTPTPTPTQTVIVGEQPIFKRKTNKKGKPTGKAVLSGFTLDFGVPLNGANAANYQVDSITTKKVKKKTVQILHPITKFTVSYVPVSDAVQITFGASETFPTGGQLTVLSGVKTASGGMLSGNAVFTISKGGKSVVAS